VKVFKIKENRTGSDKARLCAKSFSHKIGFDYIETFSTVICYDSIRILLAIAASENLESNQFDIKTVFINVTLNEDIYIYIYIYISSFRVRLEIYIYIYATTGGY